MKSCARGRAGNLKGCSEPGAGNLKGCSEPGADEDNWSNMGKIGASEAQNKKFAQEPTYSKNGKKGGYGGGGCRNCGVPTFYF